MDKKNIVIITRTFFPAQAPRSMRATELAKEFARKGNDVTVYAVLGRYNYTHFTESTGIRVKNIGEMYFAKKNSDGQNNTSIFNVLLTKIFNYLLEFPDIELSYRVNKILNTQKNIDLLITVAVPHPIHWGAALSHRKFNKNRILNWVADSGDPYIGNEFVKHPFYFKYIEKWFCRRVDYLVVPTEFSCQGYYKEFHNKIKVIPQGFNFSEFVSKPNNNIKLNKIPTFIYAGTFYKGVRDPSLLLEFLISLNIDFKFKVYTQNVNILKEFKVKLGDKLEISNYIPRLSLLEELSAADFLINFENGTLTQTPSKLIDYALSTRPILSIPSMSINKNQILDFLNYNYTEQLKIENIDQYDIKNVTDKFLNLIK